MFRYEREAAAAGAVRIAGIDEAGRGPLAGPVVVAGVVMPQNDLIEGVDDSKKLSADKRRLLYALIMAKAVSVEVAVIENDRIDEINILNATKEGMRRCMNALQADCFLIDAVKMTADVPVYSIIHGDALSYSIAAASIVAKVTRDKLMTEYDEIYPQYGFAKHKGYGTAEHIAKLKQYGPCPLHRKTFIGNFVKL